MDRDEPDVGPEPAATTPPAATGTDEPAFSLWVPAVVYGAAFVMAGVLQGIWIGVTGDKEITLALTVATLMAQWTGLIGGCILVSRRFGRGRLSEDLGLRLERRDVGTGLAAGVLSQLVILPLLYLPVRLLDSDLDLSEEARRITNLGSGAGLVLLAACIVIGAPLAEELFFRGLLQRSLGQRFGPRWAVGGTAVLFGLTHFQPLLLPGLTAFGLVLGILVQRRGRLGPALVAHMAFNAVTVIALTA